MNIVVVDDERLILQTEKTMLENMLKDNEINAFSNVEDALDYAKLNKIDIAFLDINLEADNGLAFARKLQKLNPIVNIIFCTGYSEYSIEALDMYCSGYLMKPITEEKLEKALANLRYPITEEKKDLVVKCFGHFEVIYKGKIVKFKYEKTKQMFAYLIDRRGTMLSLKEIMTAIFEEDGKESYMRNLKADLINTFTNLGIEYVLIQDWGKLGIKVDKISCDYYDYLNGKSNDFHGEYMTQYSFGEITLARLG